MGIAQRRHGIVGILSCSILSIAFCTSLASASTLRVPEEYSTIQNAIDAAVDFDTVLINDGTYTGDGNRDIDFLGKAIVVKSVNGASNTIIDCQADSTNPHRGFIFHSGEDSLSILQGLTIKNGFAPGNVDSGQSNGGGILCDSGSSPIIVECIITQNWAQNSGGGLAIFNSSPRLTDCEISHNTAYNNSDFAIPGYGGGIRCYLSDNTKFLNCILMNNRANLGGGMSSNNSDVIIDSCCLADNIADILWGPDPAAAGIGGGLHLFLSDAILTNCEISGNLAKTMFGTLYDDGKGGGGYIYLSNPTLRNCSIVNNIAEGWPSFFIGQGAGLTCSNSSVQIEQCIVAYNEQGESIFLYPSATISIFCTDIYGNEFGNWISTFDSLQNLNSNFSSDPQFCDPHSNDYQLSQKSPCLEGQSSCGQRVGVHGIGCVSTGVEDDPSPNVPMSIVLHQNYPNPFNATTTISFDSLTKSSFQLCIYNILGETVHQVNGMAQIGLNSLTWDAKDFASGIYFYSLKLSTNTFTRKMLLLK